MELECASDMLVPNIRLQIITTHKNMYLKMYVIYYDLLSTWYLDLWNIHIICQFQDSFGIQLSSMCDK
jgi:hypothetical protein